MFGKYKKLFSAAAANAAELRAKVSDMELALCLSRQRNKRLQDELARRTAERDLARADHDRLEQERDLACAEATRLADRIGTLQFMMHLFKSVSNSLSEVLQDVTKERDLACAEATELAERLASRSAAHGDADAEAL